MWKWILGGATVLVGSGLWLWRRNAYQSGYSHGGQRYLKTKRGEIVEPLASHFLLGGEFDREPYLRGDNDGYLAAEKADPRS